MNIQGNVEQLLPTEFVGDKKTAKQVAIVNNGDKYNPLVAIEIWGDKVEELALRVGDGVDFKVNVFSREWEGKWYTNVSGWDCQVTRSTAPAVDRLCHEAITPAAPESAPLPKEDDDLPF